MIESSMKEYWLKKLAGEPNKSTFLQDCKKIERGKRDIETINVECPHSLYTIEAVNDSNSLFCFLAASLIVLLHKYNGGETDILVDTPAFPDPGGGECVNTTLPLRINLDRGMTFYALLQAVRETIEEAHRHGFVPIGMDLPPDVVVSLDGLHERECLTDSDYNIHFAFSDEQERGLRVEYNANVYLEETIGNISNHFMTILNDAATNGSLRVDRFDILSSWEKKRILEGFNHTDGTCRADRTIHELFESTAREYGDNPAVIEGLRQINYKELNKKANGLAVRLRETGVTGDTIVGLVVERSIEMVICQLAILKSGGAYLSVDPKHPDTRIGYMLKDSAAPLLLARKLWYENNKQMLSQYFNGRVIFFDELPTDETDNAENLRHATTPDNLAYVIYTSGSTGKPKGVLVPHRGIPNLVHIYSETFDINSSSRVGQFASLSFDASVSEIFCALLTGAALVIIPPDVIADYGRFTDYINHHGVTWLTLPPIYVHHLDRRSLETLEVLVTAGSAPERELVNGWRQQCLYSNAYGPTETSIGTTLWVADKAGPPVHCIPIGKPFANINVYILDKQLRPVPMGAPGEICAAGFPVVRGYLNRPDLTDETFIENPFVKGQRMYKTGDLGRWLRDGNIEFLGRMDFQVKIRGFRVEPGEIENALTEHEAITDAAVIPLEPETGETYLCAYVVTVKNIGGPEMREFLSRDLPDYMVPSHFVRLEEIPLNDSGKVDRNALPRPGKDGLGDDYAPPETLTHKTMVSIWAEVLGLRLSVIGIDSGFFDLGGHSLKAAIVNARIHKVLRVRVTMADMFEMQTIRRLSAYIDASEKELDVTIQPAPEQEYYRLSSAQKRLFIVYQMEPESTGYNIQLLDTHDGLMDKDAVGTAFRELIRRHESLRTAFLMVDGEGVQAVREDVNFSLEYYRCREGRRREQDKTKRLPMEQRKGDANGDRSSWTVEDIVKSFVRPFDLARPPLMRVGLVHIRNSRSILMLDMHHIISDGISMGIIVKEFRALYGAQRLPSLKLQYKDFAEWRNSPRELESSGLQEAYWLEQFGGDIPVLNLPTDYIRPSVRTFDGDTLHFRLNPNKTGKLKKLAQSEGVTLYMLLLAIYNMVLAKLTGQEDIVVGTVTAGRRHADLYSIVGMFANTLALRNFPAGDKGFKSFLAEVKGRTIDAFVNQDFPFEELVSKVARRKDTSRNPLFDVTFGLENQSEKSGDLQEVVIPGKPKPYDFNIHQSKFDMTLIGIETDEGLLFSLEYNTRLFKEETIKGWIRYFKTAMNSITEDPDQRIFEVNIMPREERNRLLYEFNETETAYRDDVTIHGYFEETAERFSGSVALWGESIVSGEEVTLTYGELNNLADELASELHERGLSHGRIAAVLLPRSVEMVISFLAILKVGAAYLPIDPQYPEERIRYILDDSNAWLSLTPTTYPRALSLGGTARRGRSRGQLRNNHPITPDSPAYIIYTSGTTGRPKGVVVRHRGVPSLNTLFTDHFGIGETDRIIQFASSSFDASVWEIYMAILNGAGLYLPGPGVINDYRAFENFLNRHNITAATLPPVYAIHLDPDSLVSLRILITAGSAPGVDLVNRWKNKTDYINAYGPTESTVCATYWRPALEGEAETTPIGVPIPNINVFILDNYGMPVPINVPGELCIAGTGLALGYLNQPELTSQKFFRGPGPHAGGPNMEDSYTTNSISTPNRPHVPRARRRLFYKSGDLARWLPDGNVEFMGRIDRQVKIRGFRIELGEIETQLRDIEYIRDAAVLAREDARGETYLCAYVVPGRPIFSEKLRRILLKHLPDYMVPHFFVEIDEIPLTPNGKVDEKSLPEPDLSAGKRDYEAPSNARQERLAEIWGHVLGVRQVSIRDDFFQLGGDSIKAIEMISALRKDHLALDLKELFLHRTIERLWRSLQPLNVDHRSEQGPVTGEVALTPIQKWFFQNPMADSAPHHFNQWVMLREPDGLEPEYIETALLKLVEHHDALRMVLKKENGAIGQINRGLKEKEKAVQFKVVPLKSGQSMDALISSRKKEIGTRLNLERGPLMWVELYKHSATSTSPEDVLLLIIHHLVVDGVSWRILLEDFRDAYEQARKGKDIRLPAKTDSFRTWSLQLEDYARSERLLKEFLFWKQMDSMDVKPLPYRKTVAERRLQDMDAITLRLSVEDTEKLVKDSNFAYNTEINDLLLTALGSAINRWCGMERIRINLEGHGREQVIPDVDIHRTAGWFTSQFPVVLEMFPQRELCYQIKAVKEVLRGIPHKGFGYGILKYLTPKYHRNGGALGEPAEINFNYLGRFDTSVRMGADFSPDFIHPHALDIVAILEDERLTLHFSYHKEEFREDEIQQLTGYYKDSLETVIHHCTDKKEPEITSSDLGYPHILTDTFDILVEKVRERLRKRETITSIYPLTPMQHQMFLDTLEDREAYFVQNVLAVPASAEREIMRKSFELLVNRYDIFRTLFIHLPGMRPLQVVIEKRGLQIDVQDISHLDSAARERVLEIFREYDKTRGFDLTRQWPLRLTLFLTGEEHNLLVCTVHHIIMDGWCFEILMREFTRMYKASVNGDTAALANPVPYRTYVDWLEDMERAEGLAYWEWYLQDFETPRLLLDPRRPAPEGKFQLGEYHFSFDSQFSQCLNHSAMSHRVTLNSLFQVIVGLMLKKHLKKQDVMFGSIVSGRSADLEGIDTMVGLFINIIPVRINTAGDIPLAELLKEVQHQAGMANYYDSVPLAEILPAAGLPPETIDTVLFFENYPGHGDSPAPNGKNNQKFQVRWVENIEQFHYPLNIYVLPGEEIKIRFNYNASLFDNNFIQTLAADFKEFAAQLTACK